MLVNKINGSFKKFVPITGWVKVTVVLTRRPETLSLVFWKLSRFSEWENSINRNLRVNSWMSLFNSMVFGFDVKVNFSSLLHKFICLSVNGLDERLIIWGVIFILSSRFDWGRVSSTIIVAWLFSSWFHCGYALCYYMDCWFLLWVSVWPICFCWLYWLVASAYVFGEPSWSIFGKVIFKFCLPSLLFLELFKFILFFFCL